MDGAFLGCLAGVAFTIAAAHPVLLDNTAALRLTNVNHILVCEDSVLITLTTTHVPVILASREEIVTLTSIIASHLHVSMEVVQIKLVDTPAAVQLVTLDHNATLT